MAKFRVEVDVSFNEEKDAIAFLNLIEQWKNKVCPAKISTHPQDIPIVTKTRYHECFHDEVPPKPCGDYVIVEFDAPSIEHTTKVGDVMMVSADNTKSETKSELSNELSKIKG